MITGIKNLCTHCCMAQQLWWKYCSRECTELLTAILGTQLELASLPDRSMSPSLAVTEAAEKLRQAVQMSQVRVVFCVSLENRRLLAFSLCLCNLLAYHVYCRGYNSKETGDTLTSQWKSCHSISVYILSTLSDAIIRKLLANGITSPHTKSRTCALSLGIDM